MLSAASRQLVAACALAAFAAAYALPALVDLPQLWYLPLAHAWRWGARPEGLVIALFGRMLAALLASGAAALLASLVVRRRPPRAGTVAIALGAGAIGLAALLCLREAGQLGAGALIGQLSP